MNNGRIVN